MKPLFALALLGILAGCNTVEGFGRDLAAGGTAIEEASTEARKPQPVYNSAPQQPIYQQQPAPTPIY